MSFFNKIIMSSLLGLITIASYAMEDERVLSMSPEVSNYSFLNITFSDAVQCVTNRLSNGFVSLNNSFQTAAYDEAILLKLGWTSSCEKEQQKKAKDELKKSKQIYFKVRTFEYNHPDYKYNREAKERRHGFLYRALVVLEDNIITKESERISLALHCLDHHNEIMDNFDKVGFKKIIPHEMWNKKICRKLGWPPSDTDAQKKLEKIKKFYENNINNPSGNTESISNSSEKKQPSFLENLILLEHLREYCQEILLAFHHNTITDHSTRAGLALHCIEYHKSILSDVDAAKFLYFAKESQQKIEQDKQVIDEKLASLTIEKK